MNRALRIISVVLFAVGPLMLVMALLHLLLSWFPLHDQSLRGFAFASLVLVCGMILTLFVLCLGASFIREMPALSAAKNPEAPQKIVVTSGLSRTTAKMLIDNSSSPEAEKPQTN